MPGLTTFWCAPCPGARLVLIRNGNGDFRYERLMPSGNSIQNIASEFSNE